MPRSFQKRRGKPRIELQQENVRLPQKQQQPTTSRLSKIKNRDNKSNKNINKNDGIDEKELEDKMWKHASVSKENPIAAPLHRSQFAVRFPQSRETYIRTVFAKVKLLSYLLLFMTIPDHSHISLHKKLHCTRIQFILCILYILAQLCLNHKHLTY